MTNDDSYPPNWFPQVTRANAERQREQMLKDLMELPDEVLARALQEAQKAGALGPLAEGPGA